MNKKPPTVAMDCTGGYRLHLRRDPDYCTAILVKGATNIVRFVLPTEAVRALLAGHSYACDGAHVDRDHEYRKVAIRHRSCDSPIALVDWLIFIRACQALNFDYFPE